MPPDPVEEYLRGLDYLVRASPGRPDKDRRKVQRDSNALWLAMTPEQRQRVIDTLDAEENASAQQ